MRGKGYRREGMGREEGDRLLRKKERNGDRGKRKRGGEGSIRESGRGAGEKRLGKRERDRGREYEKEVEGKRRMGDEGETRGRTGADNSP